MEASKKSAPIDKLLTNLTGKDRTKTIAGAKCMTCPGQAVKFRNDISRKEYTISGMCQDCQDDTFGKD